MAFCYAFPGLGEAGETALGVLFPVVLYYTCLLSPPPLPPFQLVIILQFGCLKVCGKHRASVL
jgi:hypothetical protein